VLNSFQYLFQCSKIQKKLFLIKIKYLPVADRWDKKITIAKGGLVQRWQYGMKRIAS
jgi:hypothetical protein